MNTGAHLRVATEDTIAAAAALIRAGRLVAFPTETVYGLGADATSEQAVARIFAAKGRPRFNPLIIHVGDLEDIEGDLRCDPRAHALAAAFWPGPLTLVLPRRPACRLSLLASAGLDSVAVRAPSHPVARALIEASGRPIAAPSANPFGRLSPTTAAHVADGLGGCVDLILDGGACPVGIESTIVDLCRSLAVVLRPGAVDENAIAAVIGPLGGDVDGDAGAPAPRAPGMLRKHYAPGRPLRLDAHAAGPGEALLGFGPAAPAAALNLSPAGDLVEAAAHLFAMLHALDRPEVSAIAVMPIPDDGLGVAINDRLKRAAARGDDDDTDDFGERGLAMPCVLPDAAADG